MSKRLKILVAVLVCLAAIPLIDQWQESRGYAEILSGIQSSKKTLLYEGLPHQSLESNVLATEVRTKKTISFGLYRFYEQVLPLKEDDNVKLKEMAIDSGNFKSFSGEKKCGGFHPDYAVEWHDGADKYRLFICFGCDEVLFVGRGKAYRFDVARAAIGKFESLLRPYQSQRPTPRIDQY